MTPASTPLLQLDSVTKEFRTSRSGLGMRRSVVHAVDAVSLDLNVGETLGLVGESGSGKSTLARLVVRILDPTSGSIMFDGHDITRLNARQLRPFRSVVQMVFQDPYSSFDPQMRMSESVVEPLLTQVHSARQARTHVERLTEMVGLRPELANRYPSELSGGQLQRMAIGRALSTQPKLLVLDEPVSSLDVSMQAQIINVLRDLQTELGLTYLFVAHDLAIVRHMSTRLAVMQLGRIVESGPVDSIYRTPAHPYTAALLSSVPGLRSGSRIALRGEIPSPLAPPSGCRFRTRCPWAMPVCAEVVPAPFETAAGVSVRCHLHTEGPRLAGDTVRSLMKEVA